MGNACLGPCKCNTIARLDGLMSKADSYESYIVWGKYIFDEKVQEIVVFSE